MAAKVEGWRDHLGAHKTATTRTLAAIASDLRQDGVAVLPCHAVRPILRDLGSWRAMHRLLGQDVVARRIEARLAALAADGSEAGDLCVAFSDENVLGPLIDVMSRKPYPRLARRLGSLALMAQGRPTAHFLSIRRFGRVLPGACATALRYRRLSPLIVRRRERILGRPPPRWTDVLDRIARAAPGLPIRVCRQEDYASAPRPILSAFLGRDMEAAPDLPPPPSMTPSAEAIAEVERLIRAGAHRIEPARWPQRGRPGRRRRSGPSAPPLRPASRRPTPPTSRRSAATGRAA